MEEVRKLFDLLQVHNWLPVLLFLVHASFFSRLREKYECKKKKQGGIQNQT